MDPKEFREVGHRVVDMLAEYLETIEDKPVFPNVEPSKLTEFFAEPLPQDPSAPERVLGELEEKLLPYCTNVGHPGYMGLITPSPNPIGIIGDFICSALNQNIGAYTIGPAAVAMERRTVRWLTDLAGYDDKAGGNLTSGDGEFHRAKTRARCGLGRPHTTRWSLRTLGRLRVGRTPCFGR
jgi:aromatic-L-amino-acid decarboxylase